MGLKLVTGPETEPISLAEAKNQCRVDSDITEDDDLITFLIGSAREKAEEQSNLALLTQTWDLVLDTWPEEELEIPLPPLQSIDSISYTLADGSVQTFDPDNYVVDTDNQPGRIALKSGVDWPSDELQPIAGIRIRFTCGFTQAADIPKNIILGMRLLIGHYYENRETVISTGAVPKEIPLGASALFGSLKLWSF